MLERGSFPPPAAENLSDSQGDRQPLPQQRLGADPRRGQGRENGCHLKRSRAHGEPLRRLLPQRQRRLRSPQRDTQGQRVP